MPYQEGDIVWVKRRAELQMTKYDRFRPEASISRELGKDPEKDLEDMEALCKVELAKAMLAEIQDSTSYQQAFEEEQSLAGVIAHAERVIANGGREEEGDEEARYEEDEVIETRQKRTKKRSKKRKRRE